MVAVTLTNKTLYPTQLLYDSANSVHKDGDANTSLIARAPKYIAIEGMTEANLTSVKVQVQIHPDGAWHDFESVDITIANALVEFLTPPNAVRVVRDGTDDYVVYAQLEDNR